jgi:hypothetical protein
VWWDRSEIAEAYISPSCLGVTSLSTSSAIWRDTTSIADSCSNLADVLSEAPFTMCGRVRVWLASTLTRPMIVPASAGVRNAKEAKVFAAMIAADATGMEHPVRIWIDGWRRDEATLAVAVNESLLTDVSRAMQHALERRALHQQVNSLRRLSLISLRPWWNKVLNDELKASFNGEKRLGWSLSEPDGLVHGLVAAGRVVDVGFDTFGPHDADGTLVRRRIEVRWGSQASSRHLKSQRNIDFGANGSGPSSAHLLAEAVV